MLSRELGLGVFCTCTIYAYWLDQNAVNLTDGLDGLLSGTAAIAFGAFSIIAVAQEQFGAATLCKGQLWSCTWIFSIQCESSQKCLWEIQVH